MTKEQAVADILKTAKKTNKQCNSLEKNLLKY